MKTCKLRLPFFLGVILITCLCANYAFADGLIIISNKKIAETSLTRDDVKKIYSGKKTKWGNNETIVVTVLDGSDAHKAFLKEFVKKSPTQFKLTWKKMMFTGKGTPPKKFKDMKSLVEFVEKTDGAIGYITPDMKSDGIKVIVE